jgi:hypothetical protein
MRENRKACWGLVAKDHSGDQGVDGRIILKLIVNVYAGNMWIGF